MSAYGKYGASSGTGAKSISSTSYSGGAQRPATGVSPSKYGAPTVSSTSKPMTSYSGGAPAGGAKPMTSYSGGPTPGATKPTTSMPSYSGGGTSSGVKTTSFSGGANPGVKTTSYSGGAQPTTNKYGGYGGQSQQPTANLNINKNPGLGKNDDPMFNSDSSNDLNNRDRPTMKRVGFEDQQRSGSKYGNQGNNMNQNDNRGGFQGYRDNSPQNDYNQPRSNSKNQQVGYDKYGKPIKQYEEDSDFDQGRNRGNSNNRPTSNYGNRGGGFNNQSSDSDRGMNRNRGPSYNQRDNSRDLADHNPNNMYNAVSSGQSGNEKSDSNRNYNGRNSQYNQNRNDYQDRDLRNTGGFNDRNRDDRNDYNNNNNRGYDNNRPSPTNMYNNDNNFNNRNDPYDNRNNHNTPNDPYNDRRVQDYDNRGGYNDNRNDFNRPQNPPAPDWNTPGGSGYSNEVRQMLVQVGEFMQKNQIFDLTKVLDRSTISNGVYVVELSQLLNFLGGRALGFNRDQAFHLAAQFFLDQSNQAGYGRRQQNSRWVDLSKLNEAIIQQEYANLNEFRNKDARALQRSRFDAQSLVKKVHDAVEGYIMQSGGSVYQVFQKIDRTRSNFLSPQDLLSGLQMLGERSLGIRDVEAIMNIMDENRDGRISYIEFQSLLENCSITTRMDDQSHPLFNVFEGLRRRLPSIDRGLAQYFNARQDRGRDGKNFYSVQWGQLLQTMERELNIYLPREGERDLADLLGVQIGNDVNLSDFQTLVGLADENHSHKQHRDTLDYYQKMKYDPQGQSKRRQAIREVVRKLLRRGVTAQAFRYEIQGAMGRGNFGQEIPSNTFMDILDNLADPSKRLDQFSLQEISRMFSASNNSVNYVAFLTALESQAAMQKTAAYLFGQLEAICYKRNYKNLRDLFRIELRLDDRGNRMTIQGRDVENALNNQLRFNLTREEIELLLIEYDPSGHARDLDVDELDKDYFEYTDRQKRNSRDDYGYIDTNYNFDEYWRKHGRNGPAPSMDFRKPSYSPRRFDEPTPQRGPKPDLMNIASRCQEELNDINNELKRGHAGPSAWLRNYARNNEVSRDDWVKALQQLDIRRMRDWRQSATQIYDMVQGNPRDPLPTVNDFVDMLEHIKNMPVQQRVGEEKTLEQVARFFNGDDQFLISKANQFQGRNRGNTRLREFSEFIYNESRSNCDYRLQDIENMLSPYQYDRDEVDINKFIQAFNGLCRNRGLRVGRYQPPMRDDFNERRGTPDNYRPPDRQPDKFNAPSAPRGNIEAAMASIGRMLIDSRKNYEEVLLRQRVPGGNPSRPTITQNGVYKALSDLGLRDRLRQEEGHSLTSFFKDRANQKTQDVPITTFLEQVGLKAQTIGASGAGGPRTRLDQRQLEQIAKLLIDTQSELDRYRKPFRLFENAAQQTKGELQPNTFVDILEKELGVDFVRKQRISDYIDLITAYTCERDFNMISIRKLHQAFGARPGDRPLPQEGAAQDDDYKNRLQEQLRDGSNVEIMKLVDFMQANHLGITNIIQKSKRDECPINMFKRGLDNIGYRTENLEQLLNEIDNQAAEFVRGSKAGFNTSQIMSIARLKNELVRAQQKKRPDGRSAETKMSRFDTRTRQNIEKISQFLQQNNMTVQDLHQKLDINRDGKLQKNEFVKGMKNFNVRGLNSADLGVIFDALDINNCGDMSVDEFSLFLEGAKRNRQQRIQQLDPNILREIEQQVGQLFDTFDEDKNGQISADEIHRTLYALDIKRTLDECLGMIREVSRSDVLDRTTFAKLMVPLMQEEMMRQEDRVQDLRAKFLEADVDNSGFLTVDELYNLFNKMGAGVSENEVIQMMAEVDIDRDGQLDLDEFISILSLGDNLPLSHPSRNTYSKIQKARKINPLDFLKLFKNMPTNFIPSFVEEKWTKDKQCLPSSVFKAQVDPRTMLWKDVREAKSGDIPQARGFKPDIRPIESTVGCMIQLESATGVPLPQVKGAFKDEQIVKRAVRIAIDHDVTGKRELIHNAIQIPAFWRKQDEDIWKFDGSPLKDALFRTTLSDNLDQGNAGLIFELVVYVQGGNANGGITEMSCGWCELPLKDLQSKRSFDLAINGGSPTAKLDIKKDDIRTNRSFFQAAKKLATGGVSKRLTVSIKPLASLASEVKLHLEMMPSTCLLHHSLLTFISGFMNYKAEKLLNETKAAGFRKPSGDVTISCFPKIYDNPDIVEELAIIWQEDAQNKISSDMMNINFIKQKTVDFIGRIYPVLFSDEYINLEQGTTKSAVGLGQILNTRKELIHSALRFGIQKKSNLKPVSELTTFKPFSIRELEYQVWDDTKSKRDKFLAMMGNRQQNQGYGGGMNDGFGGFNAPPPARPAQQVRFEDNRW